MFLKNTLFIFSVPTCLVINYFKTHPLYVATYNMIDGFRVITKFVSGNHSIVPNYMLSKITLGINVRYHYCHS